MDAVSQIVIVGPYEGITEIPRIFSEYIVGDIKTEGTEIFDKENRRCSGVAFAEHMDLPQVRNKQSEMADDLVH